MTRPPTQRTAASSVGRPSERPAARGFTLLELIVVMAIMSLLLVLLPAKIDMAGAGHRLDSAANTLVSVMTAAHDMAIIDGHDTRVQFDLPGSLKDRTKTGAFRYVVSSQQRQRRKLRDDGESSGVEEPRQAEEEWIETMWRPLPDGVGLWGISLQSGDWTKRNPRGDPVEVTFSPDGAIRPACAIRVVSMDLPSTAANTRTVVVNALTSAAEVQEGEQELPRDRDPSDFK